MEVEEKKELDNLQVKLLEAITKEVGSLKETIEAKVGEKIEAEVKKLGMDKFGNDMQKMFGSGKTPEENAKGARLEKGANFIKALFKANAFKDMSALAEFKTGMVEGTDSQGGYLVPEEVASEVDRVIEDFGLIRKLARNVPMTRDTLNFPNLATAMTVSVPGEATAQTDGSPVLGNTALVAKTIVGLALVSKELLADANQSVAQFVFDMAGEAIAGYEDSQGLTGTGSPFTGVMGNSSVTVVTMASGKDTFAETALDDLIDLTTNVKSGVLGNACFVMHRSVFGLIRKITESSIHITSFINPSVGWNPNQGGLAPAGFILGFPVYCSDKMVSTTAVSTKFIIFGNFNYFYRGNRQQMTMDISDSATVSSVNAFASNQQAIRVTERVGLAVGVPTAFAVLKTAAS